MHEDVSPVQTSACGANAGQFQLLLQTKNESGETHIAPNHHLHSPVKIGP